MLYKGLRSLTVMILIAVLCLACSAPAQTEKEQTENNTNAGTKQTDNNTNAGAEQAELLISAAASLSVVLDEIIDSFQQQHTGIKVQVNYGSSGTLQQQIEQGAPADLFISAGNKQMNALLEKELVEQVTPLLRNSLVVVSSSPLDERYDSLTALLEAVDGKHIAIGQPESVPAGQYAKQALEAEGIWSQWEDRYVYGKDVRQVLTYVEQGNAELGFVYLSDALSSDIVQTVYTVDASLHDPIEYPVAIVTATEQKDAAELFYNYLQQDEFKASYEQHGFQVVQ